MIKLFKCIFISIDGLNNKSPIKPVTNKKITRYFITMKKIIALIF